MKFIVALDKLAEDLRDLSVVYQADTLPVLTNEESPADVVVAPHSRRRTTFNDSQRTRQYFE